MSSTIALTLEKILEFEESPDQVWDVLVDVPTVVSCIPGAELLETVSDSAWKAQIGVDLGLMQVTFVADVVRRELDREKGRAALTINGKALNGRGEAAVTLLSTVSPSPGGAQAQLITEIEMSGNVARLGPGIIEDVSDEMTEQLAACLRARLAAGDGHVAQPAIKKRQLLRTVVLSRLRRIAAKLGLTRRG